ncbi:tautomerase family protein [Legionella maceachernii]|uniref:4-oxalocrotonate tautomerase n=1 Tax=Legionella maceachernii TaxID=466 RepID=A0A0W0VVW0_9GAMM|nr:tautomerase family protein [Legionella maceachernii]KTD24109.1 4-oxalocrotonate tautomerase [Legionella maceachernii]SJZ86362.1 Tautomerase enzyme [Legionella maceachernii]SUO99050.1 4-oxalocrotonate tautomerase [Legionella maceachernii]
MPIVSIDIRNSFTKEEEITLMRSVYSALQEVFQLSDDAINIRLFVHEPHRFAIPPTKNKFETYNHPELYTIISIDCFPGRTTDTKRRLYRRLTENLETCGIPQDHIKIVLRESNRENWGILGGQAGCDVDVGYKVEV